MKKYLVKHIGITILVVHLILPLNAQNTDGKINHANLFGSFYGKNELGIPANGSLDLLRKLNKVSFEGVGKSSEDKGLKIADVNLKLLVGIIERDLQPKGVWTIKIDKDLNDVKVSGTLSENLVTGLIDLMRDRKFYCRITDGVIELKKHTVFTIKDLKVKNGVPDYSYAVGSEFILSREELARGETKIWFVPQSPVNQKGKTLPFNGYTSGNTRLTRLVKREVKLEINNGDVKIRDMTLQDLAELLNSKIISTKNWRITVNDDVKDFRVSGDLNADLMITLSAMMRQGANFRCKITDGVIELSNAFLKRNQ